MDRHIRKSVSLPGAVYEAVKSIAEVEGRSFSEALSRVVRSVIEGEEEGVVRFFRDKLRLAKLKAVAYEVKGKKVALEQLAKLEDEIDREIERVEFEIKVALLKHHLKQIWEFFDWHGNQYHRMSAKTRRAVEEAERIMQEQFGKPFSVEQFFEECFLKEDSDDAETAILEWLRKYLNN